MLPPVYILIEDNPNCTSLDGLIFQPKLRRGKSSACGLPVTDSRSRAMSSR